MITIVTAYFDIGRGSWKSFSRSTDEYFRNFSRLCYLENDLILFTESKHEPRLKKYTKTNLKVIYFDLIFKENEELLNKIQKIQQSDTFKDGILSPNCPEYFSPHYVLINSLKSFFCNKEMQMDLVDKKNSNLLAWLDFGYLRKNFQLPYSLKWDYNFTQKIHLFSLLPIEGDFDKNRILKIVKSNEVYIQGCHIIAPLKLWHKLETLVKESLMNLIEDGLVDDDQTLLLMAYLKSKNDFEIHPAKLDKKLGWFFIFKHYNNCEKSVPFKKRINFYFKTLFA